jgi:hypothetical protein
VQKYKIILHHHASAAFFTKNSGVDNFRRASYQGLRSATNMSLLL